MKTFSQRRGIKLTRDVIQVDSMDDVLRNGLWNALYLIYFKKHDAPVSLSSEQPLNVLFHRLWISFFKIPIDTLPFVILVGVEKLRGHFFNCEWNEVYDIIEFIANNYPDEYASINNTDFMTHCNSVLKRELSAYRFVGGVITPLTSEEEASAIEEVLESPEPLSPAKTHVRTALTLLSDRESPDYRNSIKESISAVEAICRLLTGNPKATLGQALKAVEAKVDLHSALKRAFDSLYGYTSDAEGIRHALLSESKLDFEDAKFMLVSCSAFINYLVSKALKAGLM